MKQLSIDLRPTLQAAYTTPFKIQSDFARDNAQQVAALASMGFVSTLEGHHKYGRTWRITGIGLDALRKLKLL